MDSIRRENERVPAIGNMRVNAKGDQIKSGLVTKTADQLARENHRVQSAIVNTGLKGPLPTSPETLNLPKSPKPPEAQIKVREVELPSGDIVMEEDTIDERSKDLSPTKPAKTKSKIKGEHSGS
jgi:hypothetical protein